jgi:hypothetical protein
LQEVRIYAFFLRKLLTHQNKGIKPWSIKILELRAENIGTGLSHRNSLQHLREWWFQKTVVSIM